MVWAGNGYAEKLMIWRWFTGVANAHKSGSQLTRVNSIHRCHPASDMTKTLPINEGMVFAVIKVDANCSSAR